MSAILIEAILIEAYSIVASYQRKRGANFLLSEYYWVLQRYCLVFFLMLLSSEIIKYTVCSCTLINILGYHKKTANERKSSYLCSCPSSFNPIKMVSDYSNCHCHNSKMLTWPHQRWINSYYYKYLHPWLRSHQLHRTITGPHNL